MQTHSRRSDRPSLFLFSSSCPVQSYSFVDEMRAKERSALQQALRKGGGKGKKGKGQTPLTEDQKEAASRQLNQLVRSSLSLQAAPCQAPPPPLFAQKSQDSQRRKLAEELSVRRRLRKEEKERVKTTGKSPYFLSEGRVAGPA